MLKHASVTLPASSVLANGSASLGSHYLLTVTLPAAQASITYAALVRHACTFQTSNISTATAILLPPYLEPALSQRQLQTPVTSPRRLRIPLPRRTGPHSPLCLGSVTLVSSSALTSALVPLARSFFILSASAPSAAAHLHSSPRQLHRSRNGPSQSTRCSNRTRSVCTLGLTAIIFVTVSLLVVVSRRPFQHRIRSQRNGPSSTRRPRPSPLLFRADDGVASALLLPLRLRSQAHTLSDGDVGAGDNIGDRPTLTVRHGAAFVRAAMR
jgi:hypothetical protein